MIELFPNLIRRFLILSSVLLVTLLLLFFLVPGTNPVILCLVGILGVFLFLISQSGEANKAHAHLMNTLYEQLDADKFLHVYAPLLDRKIRNPNVEIMVRLHLSNAYAAIGEFVKAEHVLLDAKPLPSKDPEKTLLSRFAVVSNLCFCKEQELKTEDAGAYLHELLEMKKTLEGYQEKKPEKKRLTFITTFNEVCYAFLKDGKSDPDAIHSLIQKNTSQLDRVTISLWIARMYIKDKRISEARDLLERIIKIASHLSYGKQAQELLASISD